MKNKMDRNKINSMIKGGKTLNLNKKLRLSNVFIFNIKMNDNTMAVRNYCEKLKYYGFKLDSESIEKTCELIVQKFLPRRGTFDKY